MMLLLLDCFSLEIVVVVTPFVEGLTISNSEKRVVFHPVVRALWKPQDTLICTRRMNYQKIWCVHSQTYLTSS